jgi:hypothetical protein
MQKHKPLTASIAILLLAGIACQVPALPAQTASPQPASTLPAPGSLIFEDNFSDRSSGWDRQAVGEGIMEYDGGGLRMVINGLQTNFWSAVNKDLADVRIEVDEGKLGGPDENRVGLICRYTENRFYFFLITHDGFYGVGMFSGDQPPMGTMELIGQRELQTHAAINRGTNVNHLRADCKGTTLTLYVNGEKVVEVEDSRLTHGDVGLLAGTFDQPGVDVIFDNFVAIQP